MDRTLVKSIWTRAQDRCEYCQLPQTFDLLPFQCDHIIALQHGRPTNADNLALACFSCNVHKGPNIAGFDANTAETVRLFNPRLDAWDAHFQWQGPELSGRIPMGRVTIHVLAINLEHRVGLRRELIQNGEFFN